MFTFGDTDSRSVNVDLKEVDETVQQALRSAVPGLVGMQANDGAQSVLQGDMAYQDRSKHRALVPPNAFNVTTLFQPTLAFISRACEIVPPGHEAETSELTSTLEDFVVKVFLPQLDGKVTASFQQSVSGEWGV
jgi:exocyst complex component 4